MSHNLSRQAVTGTAEDGSTQAQGGFTKVPLRPLLGALGQSAWGALVVRAVSIGLALLGLAAIGTVSIPNASSAIASASLHSSLLSVAGAAAMAVAGAPVSSASAAPQAALAPAAPPASPEPATEPQAEGSKDAPPPGVTADGKIVLNTASAAELDRLPSVGPKRAEQIVALRERLGRFRSLNDLLRIRGIGARTLKKMLPHLVLDPPKPEAPSEPQESGTTSKSAPPLE